MNFFQYLQNASFDAEPEKSASTSNVPSTILNALRHPVTG
jgi:hypothetical protein